MQSMVPPPELLPPTTKQRWGGAAPNDRPAIRHLTPPRGALAPRPTVYQPFIQSSNNSTGSRLTPSFSKARSSSPSRAVTASTATWHACGHLGHRVREEKGLGASRWAPLPPLTISHPSCLQYSGKGDRMRSSSPSPRTHSAWSPPDLGLMSPTSAEGETGVCKNQNSLYLLQDSFA